jgi:hypothetical protein
MNALSDQVEAVIRRLFASGEAGTVSQLMADECNEQLPLTHTAAQRERIQLAVLKLCRGDTDRLINEIRGAQRDWRDTLVAAGFGNDLEAHHRWAEELLGPSGAT